MNYSEQINEIAAAFAKAQSEMSNPGFDAKNPHFNNKFASLAAVRNAVVPILAKHGIAIFQDLTNVEGGVACTTILIHTSGQRLEFGPLIMPFSKADAQGFGSAGTYCKRYAMMAICCVVGDFDDDANAATGKPQAYAEAHRPQGDMGKDAPKELLETIAQSMRDAMDEDADEQVIALRCLDLHDMLNKEQGSYVAASALLKGSEKSAWRNYLKEAKSAAQVPLNTGRA